MDCAHQAPLSMGLARQEYWSGLPFPASGDLPNPGIEPGSAALANFRIEGSAKCLKDWNIQNLSSRASSAKISSVTSAKI